MISVIIPTYNWSSVLQLAIESVLWQTYQDFEIIVVGDCCTDNSETVVASFNDSRIKWHNLSENSGSQSIPNNFGIQMAQGEWIAHLGHDDIWYPTHLEKLMDVTTEADFVYAISASIGPDNEETEHKNKCNLHGINPYKHTRLILPPSAIMYKKKICDKIGLWRHYKELSISPDHDFELRAYEHCNKRIAPSRELTIFKFPSSWRKNSYLEKPIHQQLECIKNIENKSNFRSVILAKVIHRYIKDSELEWMSSVPVSVLYPIIDRHWAKNPELAQQIISTNKEKGASVTKSRIYRGLEN